jgi:hypothetical protein
LEEEIIGLLEARIKDLKNWWITLISTMFPSCTSIGGEIFFGTDSMSQVQIGEIQDSEREQENVHLGENFNGGNVMIKGKKHIREGMVRILTLSLQPILQRKGRGHLLQILIKNSHHIIEIISNPEEPTHPLLLLLMPMQDSETVT